MSAHAAMAARDHGVALDDSFNGHVVERAALRASMIDTQSLRVDREQVRFGHGNSIPGPFPSSRLDVDCPSSIPLGVLKGELIRRVAA